MYIMLNMNYPSSFKEFNEVLKSLNANVNGKQLELIQEQWKKPCHGFHSHYTGANMRKKIYNDRVDLLVILETGKFCRKISQMKNIL